VRRLLVTGGAGFIGSNFVRFWAGENPGDRIVVLDALTYAGNLASLRPVHDHPEFRFVRGDICDQGLVERLMSQERIDTLVHFAAESHVDRSIVGPDAFIGTNVTGTHSLLKAARKVWLEDGAVASHRFHHVSTDEVFGSLGPADPAFTELSRYSPNSPYSASKAAADHLVRAYHHTYGLDVTTSNCSNNYGPQQFPEKLIPLMILNALSGKPLPVYGDGGNVRDWLHVEDHCRAIDLLLTEGRSGEVYNIGGGNEVKNLDLTHRILGLLGRPTSLIKPVEDRPGHDRRYSLGTGKLRGLGWKPAHDFEEGLAATVDWYRQNDWWWRPIKEQDPAFRAYYASQYGTRPAL
jgi:dTDP-glucose 4,6-dehydratase